MSASPNLKLPFIDANQNQKSVTHNAALTILDALVNLQVQSNALSAPPGAPADGQCWIVAAGGSGAWAGKDLNIAAWQDGAWNFYAPNPGFIAYVDSIGGALMWNGTAWVSLLGAITQLSLNALGIGTAVDSGNPLSTKLNSALFAALPTIGSPAGTGDVRVKLSKQAATNTASFLFQDNFSGRAEIGLAGDDNFHFKVSADGATWYDAIIVTAAGGGVAFLNTPTHPTPAAADNSTKSATTAWVAGQGYVTPAGAAAAAPVQSVAGRTGAVTLAVADVSGAAPLASPAFSGAPTVPNLTAGDSSSKIPNANFVTTAVAAVTARKQVSDAAYTVLASDRTVAITALTAARTLTLPAASAYPGGATLTVVDESGACSATNTITIAAAGTDTINGAASAVLSAPYGFVALESNTSNKWTVVDQANNSYKPRGTFHVKRNSTTAQTGIGGGFTKLQLDVKDLDVGGWYDNTTNYRYTPQEAGWYLFYCGCQLTMGSATGDGAAAAVYKNGAIEKQSGPMFSLSSAICTAASAEVTALVYMNGSTDYVEFWVYATPTGSSTAGGANAPYRNYAGGYKVSA